MNFSSKIWAGLILLLVLIMTVAGIGIFVLQDTSGRGVEVMKDNFRSVEYAHQMLNSLNHFPDSAAIEDFRKWTRLESGNITEKGEDSLVEVLNSSLAFYLSTRTPEQADSTSRSLEVTILHIMDINMVATRKKNEILNSSIQSNTRLITIGYTMVFLILISVLFNYPYAIIHPVQELITRIKEVAEGNYDQRVEVSEAGELRDLGEAFNEMAAQLSAFKRSTLAQVLFEQRRLQTVLSSLKDALLMMDENGKMLYINPVAQSVMHLSADAIIGLSAAELALRNDLFNSLYELLSQPHNPSEQPLIVVTQGEEQFFRREIISIDATDPITGINKPVGHVFMLRNITQFSALDRAKNDFLATVSHELKTPLSSINLSLKLLYDPRLGLLNEAQNQLVDQSREEVKHMLSMVGELLKLSQLETGRIKLQAEKTPLTPMIERAVTFLMPQTNAAAVSIFWKNVDAPVFVSADPDKTVWVLVNLLGNALRFSPNGGSIYLTVHPEDDRVLIAVTDEGPGILPEMVERIFEKYVTMPAGKNPDNSGTGLGLTIAREFMQAQGGKIWATSIPGQGATFWLQFQRI